MSGTKRSIAEPDRRSSLATLPAVSRVQSCAAYRKLPRDVGGGLATDLLREEIARLRDEATRGVLDRRCLRRAAAPATLVARVRYKALSLLSPSPRLVINASRVILHTTLGRSVLSERAAERVAEASRAYMDLEYDLERARRGSRGSHLDPAFGRRPGTGRPPLAGGCCPLCRMSGARGLAGLPPEHR